MFQVNCQIDSSNVQKDSNLQKQFKILNESRAIKITDIDVKGIKINIDSLIIATELPNEFSDIVSPETRSIFSKTKGIYSLVLLELGFYDNDTISTFLRDKLMDEASFHIELLSKVLYPYYKYETRRKNMINFISVRTGNDLFTLTGLVGNFRKKYVKDGNILFQRNDDRDYTGSLLIELGTDYMNSYRKTHIKSYQTILYGFDVFTPYNRDKDETIFKNDSSINDQDRPFGSFQYFGWSKKCISRPDVYAWESTIKVGKIGGQLGKKFQTVLHQDVSYSPEPKGWASQIANSGRLGISLEFAQEYQPNIFEKINDNDHQKFSNLYLSIISDEKTGTFVTNTSLGAKISNKSIKQNNHNFISQREINDQFKNGKTQFINWNKISKYLMYSIKYKITYVVHNTMLTGYGIFNSREDTSKQLLLSPYFLDKCQVREWTQTLNITLSYTTKYLTIFYNWMSLGPETNLGKININSKYSGKELDITNRWHHFAELGLTFNIH
jgi:hypothetical protein